MLLQGLTITGLIKKLGLSQTGSGTEKYDFLKGRLLFEAAARSELERLHKKGIVTESSYRTIAEKFHSRQQGIRHQLGALEESDSDIEFYERLRIDRHLSDIKKATLTDLFKRHMISQPAYERLKRELDEEAEKISNGTDQNQIQSR